jgi:flavin reductase (DIM6/NTAB) family NADH-FMN oxidoreductase RutF
MECELAEEILREKYSLIVGRVVHLEGNDDFFDEKGGMDFERARPMSMIVGPDGVCYTHPARGGL